MRYMTGNIPDHWFRPEAADTDPDLGTLDEFLEPTAPITMPPDELVETTVSPAIRASGDTKSVRRTRRAWLLGVGAILAALLLGLAIGWVMRPQIDPAASVKTPSPAASATVKAVNRQTVTPTSILATCSAQPATDSLGNPVTYEPRFASDGKFDTAWRCEGEGVGETLTFSFPEGTQLSAIGVLNGYAKTDPKSGELMYGQYRRISGLQWKLDNGVVVNQSLADIPSELQVIEVPNTSGRKVTMTITSSTAPGWATVPTRNAVLLSELQFFGAQR